MNIAKLALCISYKLDHSGGALTPRLRWFDSHLVVKSLNGISILHTKWVSFFVHPGLCFSATGASTLRCLLHNETFLQRILCVNFSACCLKKGRNKMHPKVAYKHRVFVFKKINFIPQLSTFDSYDLDKWKTIKLWTWWMYRYGDS